MGAMARWRQRAPQAGQNERASGDHVVPHIEFALLIDENAAFVGVRVEITPGEYHGQ